MCTFFLRSALFAVLLAGCHRSHGPAGTSAQPAPRADTIRIDVPVIRLTTTEGTNGSASIDSATLALLERRVMSRVASLLRAENNRAAGGESAGIIPPKSTAPEIRHGLLGTITFDDDGAMDESSRNRLTAIAQMLGEIDAPLELRATSELGMRNSDVAIARARRVYQDLIALNRQLAERDVAFAITSVNSLHPITPSVEIFWREPRTDPY